MKKKIEKLTRSSMNVTYSVLFDSSTFSIQTYGKNKGKENMKDHTVDCGPNSHA